MLSLFRKAKKDGLAAVLSGDQGVTVARVNQKGDSAELAECTFVPLMEGNDSEALVAKVTKDHHLNKHDCTTLLDIGDYQLLMVETPEVPSTELRAAIRWRVRDMIDYHVDDAMVDVFDAPPSAARGIQDHLYAVVAKNSVVSERIEQLETAGANLSTIDIPELALRNIIARLPEAANGVAMLYFARDRGLITLVRDDTLYLARTIDIGYRDLEDASADPSQLWDMLTLEIQRSMDYYDRHFQQAPISAVLIAPLHVTIPGMEAGLHEFLRLPVRLVSVDEVVDTREALNQEDAARCFLAIGAALRTETASL